MQCVSVLCNAFPWLMCCARLRVGETGCDVIAISHRKSAWVVHSSLIR